MFWSPKKSLVLAGILIAGITFSGTALAAPEITAIEGGSPAQAQVGVPVLIVVGVLFYRNGRATQRAYMGRTIRKGYAAFAPQRNVAAALADLQGRDPAFACEALQVRLGRAFVSIQQAWSDGDMAPVQHFVSDGILERFCLQLKMMGSCSMRNIMQDVHVTQVAPLAVEADCHVETIHFRVDASAKDETLSLTSGKRVQGGTGAGRFSEVWSLSRSATATTLTKDGLIEGCCPNCGTTLAMNRSVICGSCQALIKSGEYDWVLTEITQESVWAPPDALAAPAGIEELRAADAGFSEQRVEDQVSAIFWRYRAAEMYASKDYLAGVATSDFLASPQGLVAVPAGAPRTFVAGAAVGCVEVVGAELDVGGSGLDQLHVKVTWSGHAVTVPIPTELAPNYALSTPRRHDFVLTRKHGVQTRLELGLSSMHCGGCGAPVAAGVAVACEFCGSPLPTSDATWRLSAVTPFYLYSDGVRRERSPEQGAGSGQVDRLPVMSIEATEQLLLCVIGVMGADGEVSPKEQSLLQAMAARRGIPAERLQILQARVGEDGEIRAIEAGEAEVNRAFLRALVRMCLADGKVTRQERQLIKALVAHMSYREADISQVINQERATLYRQSKQLLKLRN